MAGAPFARRRGGIVLIARVERLRPLLRGTMPIVAIALVQALLSLWLADVLNTSRDEEYTMGTTAHGAAYAWSRSLGYEAQAPLYFVVAAVWRQLDDSVLFVRALSIFFTVASTFVVARIAARVWPSRPPATFVLAYVLLPFTWYAALDARSYALGLLFIALATLAFLEGWVIGADRRARALFVLAGILGVFTQYYVAFVFVGFAVGLLAMGRIRGFVSYVAAAGVVAIAALTLLRVVPSQFDAYDFTARPVGLALRATLLAPWQDYVLPDLGVRTLWLSRASYGVLSLAYCTLALAIANYRDAFVRFAIAAFVATESCYLLAATLLHVEFVPPRHYLAIELAFVLMGAAIVRGVGARRRVGIGLALVYAACAATSIVVADRHLAKYGDWRRVATFVAGHVRPGDRVAVFEADAVPAFDRYLPRPLPVLPFPKPVDPDRYDAAALSIGSQAEADAALRRLMAGGHHVWLAIDCSYGPQVWHEGCQYLERAIDARYPRRVRTDFYAAWVAELPAPRAAPLTPAEGRTGRATAAEGRSAAGRGCRLRSCRTCGRSRSS